VADLHAKLGALEGDYAARLAAEAASRAQLERFVQKVPPARHRVAGPNMAARHGLRDVRCGSDHKDALDELRRTLLQGAAEETLPGDAGEPAVQALAVRLVAAKTALEASLEMARQEHAAALRDLQTAHDASTAAHQQALARLTDELDAARADHVERVKALEAALAAARAEHAEAVAAHDTAYAAQQGQLRYASPTTLSRASVRIGTDTGPGRVSGGQSHSPGLCKLPWRQRPPKCRRPWTPAQPTRRLNRPRTTQARRCTTPSPRSWRACRVWRRLCALPSRSTTRSARSWRPRWPRPATPRRRRPHSMPPPLTAQSLNCAPPASPSPPWNSTRQCLSRWATQEGSQCPAPCGVRDAMAGRLRKRWQRCTPRWRPLYRSTTMRQATPSSRHGCTKLQSERWRWSGSWKLRRHNASAITTRSSRRRRLPMLRRSPSGRRPSTRWRLRRPR